MPFVSAKIIRLAEVDSTNNYAAKLILASNPQEGTAIMAQHQLLGRGQRGNIWEDEPGQNLLSSIILYPDFLNAANQFRLSQAVAIAISETIEDLTGIEAKIKWPNDIIVGDRKIAGILIETSWSGPMIQNAIVGIGININQKKFTIPWATSLFNETGRELDVDEVFAVLHEKVFDQYRRLKVSGNSLEQEYHQRLYRRDQPGNYIFNGKKSEGIIRGIDPAGKLIMELSSGERLCLSTHEISMEY